MTDLKERTPAAVAPASEGNTFATPIKEHKMSGITVPSFNARGEMYAVRKPVADVRVELRGHAIMGVLTGPDGSEIDRDVVLPWDVSSKLKVGETVDQEDGTYLFQGLFCYITTEPADDGTEIAVFGNESTVDCSEHDWCEGHGLNMWDGTYDCELHWGEGETLYRFSAYEPAVKQQVKKPVVYTQKEFDPDRGVETLLVEIDINGTYDKMQVRQLALEMIEMANALLERGSKMGDI